MIRVKHGISFGRPWGSVTKEELREDTEQHIEDVRKGIAFFVRILKDAANVHDSDKLSNLDEFHSDFVSGFNKRKWYTEHIKNRHHFLQRKDDASTRDVNLLDVLEMVADCVMAGSARSGKVYPLTISSEILQRALKNTVDLLMKEIVLESGVESA